MDKRATTVGTVMPHFKVKIVDENGETVPVGVPGEIWTAGYALQKGFVPLKLSMCMLFNILARRYWNDEARTREAMPRDSEGTLWMRSGDVGIMDEDGYLISKITLYIIIVLLLMIGFGLVSGRIKDLIIRGGEVRS